VLVKGKIEASLVIPLYSKALLARLKVVTELMPGVQLFGYL
jgi:hypothetical protein